MNKISFPIDFLNDTVYISKHDENIAIKQNDLYINTIYNNNFNNYLI